MVSAYFNTPPANEFDEQIAAGLLLLTGLTPDIKDPKDGPAVIAALSVCMVILTVVTFLKLGIRLFVHGVRFGADDWLIIPAYLLSMAYPALQIAMVQHGGAGKHFYDITYQEYFHYKYLAPSAATVFYVYVGLVKMSIALFNVRLTTLTTRLWKNVNWAFFATCAAYTVAALFLNVFKCNPQYASFNLLRIAESGKVPKCLSVNHMNTILRLNLALDFTALAIPIIVLWKASAELEEKGPHLCPVYTLEKDPLWNYTTLLAWIMVEIVISLVAACAPTLAYLLPRSMLSKHQASNSASKSTGQKAATGFGSRPSRNDDALRARSIHGEDEDSEEELVERRIVVKEDIKMEWQGNRRSNALGAQAGQQSNENGSLTSWYGDQSTKTGAVVYDGRQHGERTRVWVSADMSGRNSPGHEFRPGQAI
ncbi:unnamed protein product [Alternaria alternata]